MTQKNENNTLASFVKWDREIDSAIRRLKEEYKSINEAEIIRVGRCSNLEEVAEFMRKTGMRWAVFFEGRYRGNGKGTYVSVDNMSAVVADGRYHWNGEPEDRGIMRAFLTSADVPALVEYRKAVVVALNSLENNLHLKEKAAYEEYPRERTDGRWKETNPKLVAIRERKGKRVEIINAAREYYNEKKAELEELLKGTALLSSTLHEVFQVIKEQ